MIQESGVCKFRGCDAPSTVEGYCTFHYNIVNSQEQKNTLNQILGQMLQMNQRLEQVEGKLDNTSIVKDVSSKPTQPSTAPIQPTSVKKTEIKKKDTRQTSIFIPNLDSIGSANIVDVRSDTSQKDVAAVANQLKNKS